MSKWQDIVALSITKLEYMISNHACREAIWIERLCSNIGFDGRQITICCDSQSDISLAKNPTFHARIKHIDWQFHFVRNMVEDGKVKLEKVDTLVDVVDALTNIVSAQKLKWCVDSMGLVV